MPADHRQFEEQAESGRERDGDVDMANIDGVEKFGLCRGIGIEDRLELAQPVEKPPGRRQHGGGAQRGFEQEGRPKMGGCEPGREGAFRQSQILGAVPQAQGKEDEQDDERAASDDDEQANHRADHSGIGLDVGGANGVRSIRSSHPTYPSLTRIDLEIRA